MLTHFSDSAKGLAGLRFLQLAYELRNRLLFYVSRLDGFRLFNPRLLSCAKRSEPSSRTILIGEQPNPWDLLQPRDMVSRHRGAELRRRYELLGGTSLLSLE